MGKYEDVIASTVDIKVWKLSYLIHDLPHGLVEQLSKMPILCHHNGSARPP